MGDPTIKWLMFAIDLEKRGARFYDACLKKTLKPRTRDMLEHLIRTKEHTVKVLESLLEKTSEGDELVLSQSRQEFRELKLKQPLFHIGSVKYTASYTTLTVDIFNKAVDLEARILKLYVALEKAETDPVIKSVLRKLARMKRMDVQSIIDLGNFLFDIAQSGHF